MDIHPIRPDEVEAARQLVHAGGWIARDIDPARDGVAGFYEKIGFRRSEVTMERPRQR